MTLVKVLVLESEPGAARRVEERLHEAGHQTVRCHELGLPAFPCNGLIDECPLHADDSVDCALTVRGHVRPSPAPTEDGVACAIREGVPVLAAGRTALNPFAPWLAADIGEDDVVEAVERLGSEPRR